MYLYKLSSLYSRLMYFSSKSVLFTGVLSWYNISSNNFPLWE